MNTTDFIATLALVTSVAALTYTIIVDRRRPRLRVHGRIIHVFDRSPIHVKQRGPYFAISATNMGPGRVLVKGVGLTHRSRMRRWYRRAVKGDTIQGAVLEALRESPNQLPLWLDIGESLDLFYPPDSEMLEEHEKFDCFYLYDSLGSWHWAPKGVFADARSSLANADPMDANIGG